MEKISQNELQNFLQEYPKWEAKNDAINRIATFKDFKCAFSAMTAIAFEAEALAHHPEWSNVYNRLTIRLTTHDAGNQVTAKDVELARKIEKILERY